MQTKDDSGVVVFRVGRSRMAPHRVTTTRVCPVRRADRCEGMSMREIQDMTLNVSRGLERLERRLSERSERFSQEFRVLKTPEEAFGIRLTAAPVGDEIRFDRLFDQHRIIEGLEEPWREVVRRIDEYRYALQAPSIIPVPWRPILRGARGGILLRLDTEDITWCGGRCQSSARPVQFFHKRSRLHLLSRTPWGRPGRVGLCNGSATL